MFLDLLKIAFTFFSEKMEIFIKLLTVDITTFNDGKVWSGVRTMYNSMFSVGITIAAILMMVNLIDSSYRLIELKKPVVILKYFCEVTLLYIMMYHIIDLLLWIYNMGAGLVKKALTAVGIISSSGDLFFHISLDPSIEPMYDSLGWINPEKAPARVLCIVAAIWIMVSTITIMLVVYGRLLEQVDYFVSNIRFDVGIGDKVHF